MPLPSPKNHYLFQNVPVGHLAFQNVAFIFYCLNNSNDYVTMLHSNRMYVCATYRKKVIKGKNHVFIAFLFLLIDCNVDMKFRVETAILNQQHTE